MVKYLTLVAVIGCVLCGCRQEKSVKLEPQVVDANLRFSLRLLHELDEARGTPNLFFSPLSAGIALSMMLNGAGGETYTEIAQTLGYENLDLQAINAENSALIRLLRSPDPEATVDLANGVWVQNGFELLPEFKHMLQRHYNAVAQNVDFKRHPADAAHQINSWVRKQTRKAIDQIFQASDFDPDTTAVVVNALYFKGKWQSRFNKDDTREDKFTLEDGKTKLVPMMNQHGKFLYLKGEGFQAVGLPYGTGNLVFYLFVPDDVQGLANLRKQLTPDNWKHWMRSFQATEGDVAMPRFEIDAKFLLNEPLAKMGMPSAFDMQRANFERMVYPKVLGPTVIRRVVQRAVIKVDEEGTEAVAATGEEIAVLSLPSSFFMVRADHPFLFAIVHQPTGTVLFMGIVREP